MIKPDHTRIETTTSADTNSPTPVNQQGAPHRAMPSQLHTRLTLAILLLFLLSGAAYSGLLIWSSEQYHQETTQRLNQSLAMYIANREPLIENGQVNQSAMKELAHLVMVVNPIVEVYLLDTNGHILAHALPEHSIKQQTVAINPIQQWLEQSDRLPITGTNPRLPDTESVFSAFPVTDNGATAGYLYVILGGTTYHSITDSIQGSYILKASIGGIAAIALFGACCLWILFSTYTRPLRELATEMDRFSRDELHPDQPATATPQSEIQTLRRAFQAMRQRIRDQFERLQETDRVRRELVSNVSHDLRTPLASMQGYLETLIIKESELKESDRRRYLDVAYRHCRRLAKLVTELFELSKLDTGRITPNWEAFSLAELLQDITQKFTLAAEQKQIDLILEPPNELYNVYADIALIERVIENLIDNALRYTPEGGEVRLKLERVDDQVRISVSDTGIGLSSADIPKIFDRYYRGSELPDEQGERAGTGLGLAIVKRILELHGSDIEVRSQPQQGTSFSFPLPTRLAS